MKGSTDPSSPYVDPPLHARIDVHNGQSNVEANGSSVARLKRGRPLGSKDSVPRKSVLCHLEHFIKQFRGNLQGSTSSPLMVDSGLARQMAHCCTPEVWQTTGLKGLSSSKECAVPSGAFHQAGLIDPSSYYVDPALPARIDVHNGQSNVAANGSSVARLKRGRPLAQRTQFLERGS
ncbi:unnamed protein product [Prunus armeniaca]|uniref:Uncharacterized protein n=1 Tax=Prunus armeniaca TaxID=36596 RepID=A0A6J5WM38_PRUAR|nr:unnamed protein product [Prunus armeniaca]